MIFIIGISIAFFLAFLLISKKGKTFADKILVGWLILIGVHLALFYIHLPANNFSYPQLLGIILPLPLLQGPFLFLYTMALTQPFQIKHHRWLLHFVPAWVLYLYLIPFFSLSPSEKVYIFKNQGIGYELFSEIAAILITLSGFLYVIWSSFLLRQHKKNIIQEFSYTERINLDWLQYLIYGMALIWTTTLFGFDEIIFVAVVFFVIFMGYFGIKQVGIFSNVLPQIDMSIAKNAVFIEENIGQTLYQVNSMTEIDNHYTAIETPAKYLKSGLNKDNIQDIHQALSYAMNDEKLYKNAELTLTSLANHFDIHPNYLSQVINQVEAKNFYDYINAMRIEEFKKLVALPENQQYTLLALAYDCGFNSKTSFNRHFKKMTGYSPSEYLKNNNIAIE